MMHPSADVGESDSSETPSPRRNNNTLSAGVRGFKALALIVVLAILGCYSSQSSIRLLMSTSLFFNSPSQETKTAATSSAAKETVKTPSEPTTTTQENGQGVEILEDNIVLALNHTGQMLLRRRKKSAFSFSATQEQQLVVQADHSLLYWFDGQQRLCAVLRSMTEYHQSNTHYENVDNELNQTEEASAPSLFRRLSQTDDTNVQMKNPLLNLTADCQKIVGGFGQGNWVTALYMVRMATAVHGVDLQFQCSTGNDKRYALLPWFARLYEAPPRNESEPFFANGRPSFDQACSGRYPKMRIDYMAYEMQRDLRTMSDEILGPPPSAKQIRASSASAATIMYPELEKEGDLDDVVIHFRCGDVMGGAKRHDFGMIHFSAYRDYINVNDTRSVGILTQPFDKNQNRNQDKGRTTACRRATYALVDYLRNQVLGTGTDPPPRITIRNGPNETLPLAYARLVRAKQAFTSLSSFGIFPVVGTYGQGYFQKGNRGVNPWADYVPRYVSNVHRMDAPVLTTWNIMKMMQDTDNGGVESVLRWFVQPQPQ